MAYDDDEIPKLKRPRARVKGFRDEPDDASDSYNPVTFLTRNVATSGGARSSYFPAARRFTRDGVSSLPSPYREAALQRMGAPGYGWASDPGYSPPSNVAPYGRSYGEPLARQDLIGTVIAGPEGAATAYRYQRPRSLWGSGATDAELRASGYDPKTFRAAGKNLVTYQLPGGGTSTVSAVNARGEPSTPVRGAIPISTNAPLNRPTPVEAYQLGYTGEPSSILDKSARQQTPFERSYAMGYTGGARTGTTMPSNEPIFPNIPGLSAAYGFGRAAYSAFPAINRYIQSLFGGVKPKLASERGDLLRDTDNIFYGGGNAPVPSPTPTPSPTSNLAYNEPRRYHDYY